MAFQQLWLLVSTSKSILGIAVGVNVTGAGLGTFASGPLLHLFLDKYGVHGSFLLMACIVAQAVIFGALVIPSHLEIEAKIKNKIANDTSASFKERCKNHFRILQNKTLSLILLAFVLWNIPYGIILMHLPNYSISTGVSGRTRRAVDNNIWTRKFTQPNINRINPRSGRI